MKTDMLLCDYAEAVAGKLYIMGGGWSVCDPGPAFMSVAIKIYVPWDQTNEKHKIALILQDENGDVVSLGQPPREVRHEGAFEVGRPPGVKKGTPIDCVMALGFRGLPLEPDTGYRWQLEINDEAVEDVSFMTRPARRG